LFVPDKPAARAIFSQPSERIVLYRVVDLYFEMTEDLVLADRVICAKQQLLDFLHENASICLTYVINFPEPYQPTNIPF
jgi:hypothetical protein